MLPQAMKTERLVIFTFFFLKIFVKKVPLSPTVGDIKYLLKNKDVTLQCNNFQQNKYDGHTNIVNVTISVPGKT